MSKARNIKIKRGGIDSAIGKEFKRINEDEDLVDELGIFRLASLHEDLNLANATDKPTQPNIVLVNLKIDFITKSSAKVRHVIPVMVAQEGDRGVLSCYGGHQISEEEFLKFYQAIKPEVRRIDRKSHYHSEPFLAYYLCSKDGKDFLTKEFEKKGLIKVDADKKTYESAVKEIAAIALDIHSSRVMCFNCGPFLKAAQPYLVRSINDVLFLPQDKRFSRLEINVSANQHFNYSSISKPDNFEHIPVAENERQSILTNTVKKLGVNKTRLQKLGEASNRTYFISGSSALTANIIDLRKLDEEKWKIFSTAAAVKIQKTWRRFSWRKKIRQRAIEQREEALGRIYENIKELEDKIVDEEKRIRLHDLEAELRPEIDDLTQRIQYEEFLCKDDVSAIEYLYGEMFKDRPLNDGAVDSNEKLRLLLALNISTRKTRNISSVVFRDIEYLKDELESLIKRKEILEEERRSRLSGLVTKADISLEQKILRAQRIMALKKQEDNNLDIFNYVGESSNLTHQNVLYLIEQSFKLAHADNLQTAMAVISEDGSLDYCLRDEILKFIGKDPEQDRISIALCRGHINVQSRQIGGNSHWTALHLRKVGIEGRILIQAYHMDSMGNEYPLAVDRVLSSIKETALKDLEGDLATSESYQRAIVRLENIDFEKCTSVLCARQQDGYSCGYHAVFNMIGVHNSEDPDQLPRKINQEKTLVEVDEFIKGKKVDLSGHFNPKTGNKIPHSADFGMNMDLNRALSESIFMSFDDDDLSKIKKLILLEGKIKKSEKDPALALSVLNLESLYRRLLSNHVELIRYKFSADEECKFGDEENVQKREKIFEKLSSAKAAQNPQDFLNILERITRNPTLLSASLDKILQEVDKIFDRHDTPLQSLIAAKAERLSIADKVPDVGVKK